MPSVPGQPQAEKYLSLWLSRKIDQPIILYGPEGTGKRTSVLSIVREAFCGKPSPCLCFQCHHLKAGSHPDYQSLQGDCPIDDLQEVLSGVYQPPQVADYRVLFLDRSEALRGASANALLKKLEEPPEHWRVILSATSLRQVIPALRGRCIPVPFLPKPECQASPNKQKALALLDAVLIRDVPLALSLAQEAIDKSWVSEVTPALVTLLMDPSKVHATTVYRELLASIREVQQVPLGAQAISFKAAILAAVLR